MRDRWARWAAIGLPIVLVLRVLVMIQQTRDERHPSAEPSAQETQLAPVTSGQVIRFDGAEPTRAADGTRPWRSLMVVLLRQDGRPVDLDTACSLDPPAMAGGTLTVNGRSVDGNRIADWSGERTTPQRQPISDPDPDPAMRPIQRALLYGADCGASARLEITASELAILAAVASGRPAPADADPPRPGLHLNPDVAAP